MTDNPGHGKLRHYSVDHSIDPPKITGIIFLIDAANLSSTSGGRAEGGLTEAAEYLHDILLNLQRRQSKARKSKGSYEIPLLVAANKMDLFTALPAKLVKSELEAAIARVRDTKAKNLLDSGIGTEDSWAEERDWLGEPGTTKFTFEQMADHHVSVQVLGGNVYGQEGANVAEWWRWIANQI
jgi:signal recognition particle receptor subunit beta